MSTRTRYMAEYLYPGSFFPEETYRDLDFPTFQNAVEKGPDEAGYFTKDGWYAVRIRTITEKLYRADDGDETWVRDGDTTTQSFIVGRLVHFAAPEIADEEHRTLRSNIEGNSKKGHPLFGYGVLTRRGNWQVASDWDEVVTL